MAQTAVLLIIVAITVTEVVLSASKVLQHELESLDRLDCHANGIKCKERSYASENPSKAKPGEMPWHCRVVQGSKSCTGSILNSQWVIVPGHCFTELEYPAIYVYAGGETVDSWTQAQPATLHRQANVSSAALLKLNRPFNLDGKKVSAVGLYFKTNSDILNKIVTGSGYGYHNESEEALWRIQLRAVPTSRCFNDNNNGYHPLPYYPSSPSKSARISLLYPNLMPHRPPQSTNNNGNHPISIQPSPSTNSTDDSGFYPPYQIPPGSQSTNTGTICAWTRRHLGIGEKFCSDGRFKDFLNYVDPSGKSYLVGIYYDGNLVPTAAYVPNENCRWQNEAVRYQLLNGFTLEWILKTIGSIDEADEPAIIYFYRT